MRLMLHTLMKDARRLWPAVAVSWTMLAVLANADRWRADWMPSPMEAWLTLILSMAWACVSALAVQEEPLVGDRNFWTTRPHRWPALLAAKLVFVALAIHVPSFVADIYILVSRGFSPVPYLGELLGKQLLLLGALTLPAIALAAVLRNFTHFVLAVFAIAAGIAMLNGGFQEPGYYQWDASEVRNAIVRVVLALAAVIIVLVQYAKRRVLFARVLAIAAAVTAGSVSAYVPARVDYAMRGGTDQGPPRIALRTAVPDEQILRSMRGNYPGQRVVLIPVLIETGERGGLYSFRDLELEIVTPDGVHIRNVRPKPSDPSQKIPFFAFLYKDWLVLRFAPAEWERVKNAPVDIIGSAAVQFYRLGETTTMPAAGTRDVPDVGKCTASLVEGRFSENVFKLLCESPRDLPAANIRLFHPPSGRDWRQGLQSVFRDLRGPHQTWFSPLKRGQTFFHLTDEVPTNPGSQYLVPTQYFPTAQVNITPEIVTGAAIARFKFSNTSLRPLEQRP